MRGRLARFIGSMGVFAMSMLVMFFVCIWAWDAFVNGKLYYCTDGGSMDFIFGGNWVHHPESVAHVVPRPMEQPDEIKAGWSTSGLWWLWSAFTSCSVLLSALFTAALWRANSPNKRAGGKGGITSLFQLARAWPALPQHERWVFAAP